METLGNHPSLVFLGLQQSVRLTNVPTTLYIVTSKILLNEQEFLTQAFIRIMEKL
jgi:hypothetical protein